MAYQPKYLLTFSDVYQNTPFQYEAFIYKKDYTGPIYEVSGSGNPLIIETDRSGDSSYRPFISSKASLNLQFKAGTLKIWEEIQENWNNYSGTWDGANFDFIEFIDAGIDEFYLEVRRKDPGDVYNVIWKGWYIYTSDLTVTEIEPINMNLQFSDILLMKVNRFFNFPEENENPTIQYFPSNTISVLETIMRCGYFSGITNNVSVEFPLPASNTYKDGAATPGTIIAPALLLQKNSFLVDIGKYDTIFNVLSGICSQFGLMAYFRDNTLYIRSYENLINNTTRYTQLYNITGFNVSTDTVTYTLVDNVTVNDSLPELNSGVFKNLGRDQSVRFNYPSESVSIINNPSSIKNTPNYNMASVSQIASSTASIFYTINNWYMPDGKEAYFDLDYTNTALPFVDPFYPYATSKTQTFGDTIGTRFRTRTVGGFGSSNFIESEPFPVNSGDSFAFSYSAFTDGRLKNLPTSGLGSQNNLRPRPVLALILEAQNENGDTVEYFYRSSDGKFISGLDPLTTGGLPLITLTNNVGDSDRIYIDLKGTLDIPSGANIRIRQYKPYRLVNYSTPDPIVDLYVQYCNLQTFNNSSIQNLPGSQTIKSYYKNIQTSERDTALNSNIFIQDASRFVTDAPLAPGEAKTKNPLLYTSCYTNHVIDQFYMPASGANFSYANPLCIDVVYNLDFIPAIESNILANIGLTNVTIEGTYKSNAVYFIGDKFVYDLTGYPQKTFVLLDYSINLKQATYNAILYSSEFTDATGKLLNTQTIIK